GAVVRRSVRESNMSAARREPQTCAELGFDRIATTQLGFVAETLLESCELRRGPAHQVVRGAPRAPEALGDLAVRPVLVQVQPASLALMLGETRAVDVEQALGSWAATWRVSPERTCHGQGVDTLPSSRGDHLAGSPRHRA